MTKSKYFFSSTLALATFVLTLSNCAPAPEGSGKTPQAETLRADTPITFKPSSPGRPFEVGVNIHNDPGPKVQAMAAMGAKWVRVDMNWDSIEPTEGDFHFDWIEATIDNARALGLQVYATLAYAPVWAIPSGRAYDVPRTDKWVNFVSRVSEHFQGRIDHYGIWNEPNLGGFWLGSADQYVDVLLKPACEVLHAKGMTVLGPELAHLYKPTIDVGTFMNTITKKGAGNCIDILTHHIYAEGDFQQKIDGYKFWFIKYKLGLIDWLKNSKLWGKRVWITEFGVDVTGGGTREADQARIVPQELQTMNSYDWIEKAFIFEMTDGPEDPKPPYHFGITRFDGSLRPAYFSIQNLINSGLSK